MFGFLSSLIEGLFLNGGVLAASAAALIPLALHLFFRRRVKVVEFSSLKHLKEMQRHQLRRLKIRQWLLLILRMLIILVVVAAFARPTDREGSIGSHAAVSAVILMDNSASMGRTVADGNLLELARGRTRQLLELFSPTDEVALIGLARSSSERPEGVTSSSVALQKLDRLERSASPADLQFGLEAALEQLGTASNLDREIYFVGDRQLSSLPESDLLRDTDYPLYLVDLPLEEVDNLGIVAVDFGGQLIQSGHDFDLVATLKNYARRDSEERIVSLHLDGRRVAQADFSIEAGSETTVRFTRAVAGTGFHSGYVELTDDRFAADNRFYFSFGIPDQSNILIIEGDPVSNLLALALAPSADLTPYWSVKRAKPDELSQINFMVYKVVMMAGVPRLNETQLRRLQSYVRRGGALFIGNGGRIDADYFNRAWTEVTGVKYEAASPRAFTRSGYYVLDEIDLEHPIFQPFTFESGALPEIKFYTLPQVTVEGSVRELMTFSGDRPALVENKYGRGRVLTFTGPMSPEFSDLTSHGFFVPFISRVVEYLASDLTSLETRLYAGQTVSRALPQTEETIYAIDVEGPDGSTIRVAPEDDNGTLVVRLGSLDREGIYRLFNGQREVDRLAVNVDPGESDLTEVEPDQFAISLGAETFRLLEFDQPLAEAISGFRVGRELWQLFLWAAVFFLAAEMLLGRRSAGE